MRDFKKGDVVKLLQNRPERTDRGVVRHLAAGWEFEVLSAVGSELKVRDAAGCRYVLPANALEFVRSAHSPDDEPPAEPAEPAEPHPGDHPDGGPGASVLRKRMPKRRGLVTVPEAA